MNRRDERVIEALVKTARPLMLRGVGEFAFKRDSCIAACRIGSQALHHFNVKARVIGVAYIVLNAAYLRQVSEEGRVPESIEQMRDEAHSLAIGLDWNDTDNVGHFGIAVGPRLLVDLSVDQISRPEKGIVLNEPLVANMPPRWQSSGERVWSHGEAYSFAINAEPLNKNFARSRDWTLRSRWEPFVRATVRAMEKEGAR
jgi:hypothetical protein